MDPGAKNGQNSQINTGPFCRKMLTRPEKDNREVGERGAERGGERGEEAKGRERGG